MMIFWIIRDKARQLLAAAMRNAGTRVLAIISMCIMVLLVFLLVYSYNSQLEAMRRAELGRLSAVVKTTAVQIDGDMHAALTKDHQALDALTSSDADPRYAEINETLARVTELNALGTDMYTLVREGAEFQFVVTSAEQPYFRHIWSDVHTENVEMFEQGAFFGPYDDEHGKWLSAFAPIKNSRGEVVAILQADKRFDSFIIAARKSIAWNILFMLMAFVILMVFMIRSVSSIIRKEQLLHDRILEQNVTIRTAQKDVMDSIRYAKNIQFATLPDRSMMSDIFSDELFIMFKPRDIVSGDFYWVHKRGAKKYFAVADCTGHGVPGAFMSLIGNTTLTNIMGDPSVVSPAQILDRLDAQLRQITESDSHMSRDGMDISLVMYDEDSLEITYCGANRPMLHVHGNEMLKVPGCKRSIGGARSTALFEDTTLSVSKGDRLYMYSDGFADQFGGDQGKKYYTKRLRQLIGDMQEHDMHEQKYLYQYEFNLWKDGQEQVDDVLLAGLEI